MYKTYEEWKDVEHHVRKGEKSHKRNADGVPVFSDKQVEFTVVRSDEDLWDEAQCFYPDGDPWGDS